MPGNRLRSADVAEQFDMEARAIAPAPLDARLGQPSPGLFTMGRIVFNQYQTIVKCAVREISAGGARLGCKDQSSLPAEFGLVTMNDGQYRDVRAIWRSGDEVAVEFISAPRNSPVRLR